MSAPAAVAFRVDASLQIGTGHVMRCLTLADALHERGWRSHFLCREHPGHLAEFIQQRGHGVKLLSKPAQALVGGPDADGEPPLAHAAWLGCSPAEDAAETAAVLADLKPAWLIVDHYALDRRWEQLQRPHVHHILAIDDLADRAHDVDLLLDQNLGRADRDYDDLLPGHTKRLIGPRFALLRPEFAALRAASLARRQQQPTQLGYNILITLGGVDKDNATGALLQALARVALPAATRITIVMGPRAPWLEQVRQLAADLPCSTELLVNTPHMAQWMAQADLAIGAAGSTSWERCCLGLPTLMVVLADNQRSGATALDECGAALILDLAEPNLTTQLKSVIASCHAAGSDTLASMGRQAATITDGTGTQTVRQAMQDIDELVGTAALPSPAQQAQQAQHRTTRPMRASPQVRPLQADDLDLVRQWRNSEAVRRWMFSTNTITEQEHREWFAKNQNNPLRHLLVYTEDETSLGFVNISEHADSRNAEWGFYIAPDAPPGTGQRMGKTALSYAFNALALHKVSGHVLHFNQRSIRFHEKLGFQLEGRLRDEHYDGSSYHDVVLFGLLSNDYLPD
ncbi:MAG: UDP-N-acetylglucosamine--N-acetylmuramyl-(pentapeptide) pyrophosphoryl-UDP N-acetylglucosamine [Pseudomonadota bacterium]|jgi:UDP-2,4-diacetamido-2,4,6-trideoxy-beta-L-altropyranose hydrolase/UDP-4-amino-4,6-dideoxy-N-acetyl-beta-L-altrosamine N-acetyltransferase